MRKIKKSARDQLAQLRAMAHAGHRGAAGTLSAANDLAKHPNRGDWGECEQARGNYNNWCPDVTTASADEIADAIQGEQ